MAAFEGFWNFLSGIPWWAWIPIIAIIAGSIRQLVAMSHKHQERMEMIRQGMDPRDPTRR
jgi:hypothetical protein